MTVFQNQSQLPDVNKSINEGGPETREKPKEDGGRQNVTETVVEVHAKGPKSTDGDGCDHPPQWPTEGSDH